MTATKLDLDRIQGFVVRGYRFPFARYLFLQFDDQDLAIDWIVSVADEVLTAAPWSQPPASGINIAFSFQGLRALGLPDASLAGFPEEFRQGMAARADLLGDTDMSAPSEWASPVGSPQVHALVMISAQTNEALEAHEADLRAGMAATGGGTGGVTIVHHDLGVALPGGGEHFGYADGLAQPAIEGSGVTALPGQGAALGDGKWRPIRAGEFILGYPDEENVLPLAPPPSELSTNGSYLVYRKLYQDVAAFRTRLAESAQLYPGGEEMLAAKLVGRWRDGTPLALSPDRADSNLAGAENRRNAFDYADDERGLRCPIGAHVRRANPRLSLPFDGKLVNRHRLIRRGIPYGPRLADGAYDDGIDRGLIFMSLQASIQRQFEFVQSQWLGEGNTFGLGEDQDVLLGPQNGLSPNKMTVPGEPPFFYGPLARVVTVKSGEYFFVPGINGLLFIISAAGGRAV